jgi:hypothetical protein
MNQMNQAEILQWLGVEDEWKAVLVKAAEVRLNDLLYGHPVTGIQIVEHFASKGLKITLGHMEAPDQPAGTLYVETNAELLVVTAEY